MYRSVPKSRMDNPADSQSGLTDAEVTEKHIIYGNNTIVEAGASGWLDIVRDTSRDPMIWFLIATAVLFVWLGNYTDAAVLTAALLPIIYMDVYLHRRTQATTEGLAGRLASHAKVIRDGKCTIVPAIDLVPGDIVIITAGNSFPADGLIISGEGLQVDETALTGEAMPVRKSIFDGDVSASEIIPIDTVHWGTAGTRLLTGEAKMRLVYTGAETLYGQISRMAQAGSHERTPLQQAINALVTILVVVAILLCIALAGIRYYQGYGATDAVLSAVTLAIAALPEEFPVVFTFFLGVGVYRLARRQALVRRSVVVENIGRVTCICSDKTGTLTEGRLHLAHAFAVKNIDQDLLIKVAAMASRPESGDPLDILLIAAASPLEGTRLETFPFTEDRRREVALIEEPSGSLLAAVKGAPETVLSMVQMAQEDQDLWLAKIQELAATGHKIIACASRQLDNWIGGEPDCDYDFLGLLAFEDPVREGVADAVARAQNSGIRIIMVTGDHPVTSMAIAKELGIGRDNPHVIEGANLDKYLLNNDGNDVWDIDVIARARPAQKLELVKALQRKGEIVAVTGDGVNDVPALKGADIGIAMGERGTSTAREVASIVLLDDNFRTIVRAIAEGRQLFLNLKLSFAYLLMIHMPLVATAALIPLFGFPLLYLPVHIVWLELIIHPTALLVFQQLPSSDHLDVVNRHSKIRFFNRLEWGVVTLVGILVTVLIMMGYDYSLGNDQNVLHARSMAMVSLAISSATVTAALSGGRSGSAIIVIAATIGSAIIAAQMPYAAALLHLSPLHLTDWLIAAFGGLFASSFAVLIPIMQRRSKPYRDVW